MHLGNKLDDGHVLVLGKFEVGKKISEQDSAGSGVRREGRNEGALNKIIPYFEISVVFLPYKPGSALIVAQAINALMRVFVPGI